MPEKIFISNQSTSQPLSQFEISFEACPQQREIENYIVEESYLSAFIFSCNFSNFAFSRSASKYFSSSSPSNFTLVFTCWENKRKIMFPSLHLTSKIVTMLQTLYNPTKIMKNLMCCWACSKHHSFQGQN